MELEEFTRLAGSQADACEHQRWQLTCADFNLDIEVDPWLPDKVPENTLKFADNDAHAEGGESEGAVSPTEVWDSEAEEPPQASPASAPDGNADEAAELAQCRALRDEAAEPAPTTGFIVSITDKGRMRRLHFLGACGRRPGEHYCELRHYGATPPLADEIDARCRVCFPLKTQIKDVAKLPDDIDSAEESDTSSSSSASACTSSAPAPKRSRGS